MNETLIADKIIEKIKKNRISTTEIADCLGKKGEIPNLLPLSKGQFKVGKIFLVYAYNESNWDLHEQLQNVPENSVILVQTHNCNDKAIFGELVSKYLVLYRKAVAIVVNGRMRDARSIAKEEFPIWCAGVTPIGCYNKKNEFPLDLNIVTSWKELYEGAIAVCDDAGIVVIPCNCFNDDFLQKLDFIELQEDIWFYCIDTKKWSTYETVCLKKYKDTELLPLELREKFEEFTRSIEK